MSRKTVGVAITAQACLAIATLALATPQSITWAHQTQISDGVGGTHHIEPDDTPKAGVPSQTWFALTQEGGRAIGLSDCDCELVLSGAGGEAIATPALTAIAVEGLTDVPAAELTFPAVGTYVLTLSGQPRTGATFSPFSLAFPVTVAAGAASAPSTAAAPRAQAQEQEQAEQQGVQPGDELLAREASAQTPRPESGGVGALRWRWGLPGIGGVALATAAVLLLRRQ